VTYRTPHYMLSSLQDYCSGEHGAAEHVWQATMGPEAVVYVNHPACASTRDERRPNFWRGNGVLPRVAQWKDALIAVYRSQEDKGLDYTHAYFPTYAFSAHRLRDGWAFAQQGPAYLALRAANGIELVRRGPGAYAELRSHGRENVWVCMMGQAARDGTFAEFQRKVLGLDVALEGVSARVATPRGDVLSFDWEGPFLVNGDEQSLSGFRHYDGPYCSADWPASEIEVRTADYALRLDFG